MPLSGVCSSDLEKSPNCDADLSTLESRAKGSCVCPTDMGAGGSRAEWLFIFSGELADKRLEHRKIEGARRDPVTQLLKRLWPEEMGEALQEYALLLLLISMVVVAGLRGLASTLDHAYLKTSTRVIAAGSMESITTDSFDHTGQSTPKAKTGGAASRTSGEKLHTQSPHSTKP